MDLDIASPRTVAEAALLVEQHFGRIVTYEDPPYRFAGDLVRDADGRLIPRPCRLQVTYEIGQDPSAVIQRVLAAHNESGCPGRFRIEEQVRSLHVLPRTWRDAQGVSRDRRSLLDAIVSFREGEESLLEAVEEMCLAVSAAVAERVVPGILPINALVQRRIATVNVAVSAREFLTRVLAKAGDEWSWQLLNDPETGDFVLNVHRVAPVGDAQQGTAPQQ